MLKPKPKRPDPVAAFVAAACVDDPTPQTADPKTAKNSDWRRVSLLVPQVMLADIDALADARAMPRNIWLRTVIVEAMDVAKEKAARVSSPVGEVGCAFLKAAHMRPPGA
jgi:hypothetical protein